MSRWEDAYKSGELPWDVGAADPLLVRAIETGELPTGRALELGCGTGTNARALAASGWDVLGTDISPTAIELAAQHGGVRYAVVDALNDTPAETGFDLVFDRGCFHTFAHPRDRQAFVSFVAQSLRPGGMWLSLIGSTEGPPRDHGPPRRSALDVIAAIEPNLELVELTSVVFEQQPDRPAAWKCVSRKRQTQSQPEEQ